MRREDKVVTAALILSGMLAGCSQNAPAPLPLAGRTSEDPDVIAATPAPADAAVAKMLAKSRTDLNKKSYQDAVKAVVTIAEIRTLTPEQMIELKNAILNVKVQLAEAATAGDTNAVEAIAFFKAKSVVGR